MLGEKSPIVPILAGAGGAVVAVVGADKLGVNPNVAAWGTAAVGAATALGTKGVVRQVATGVGAAGVCLGALQLIASAKAEAAKKEAQQKDKDKKRQAESGGDYVTRQDLNDAMTRVVAEQKQGHCDLVTALRDEIQRTVNEVQKGKETGGGDSSHHAFAMPRGASGEDEYARKAYGDVAAERNAAVEDEYTRAAYGGAAERNATVDEERNANLDDAA